MARGCHSKDKHQVQGDGVSRDELCAEQEKEAQVKAWATVLPTRATVRALAQEGRRQAGPQAVKGRGRHGRVVRQVCPASGTEGHGGRGRTGVFKMLPFPRVQAKDGVCRETIYRSGKR